MNQTFNPSPPRPKEVAAFRALLGSAKLAVGDAQFAEGIQYLASQLALEGAITDFELDEAVYQGDTFTPQTDIVGNVVRGNDVVLRWADKMVEVAQRRVVPLLGENAGTLPRMIADKLGCTVANGLAADIGRMRTFAELNDAMLRFKKSADDMKDFISSHSRLTNIDSFANTAYRSRLASDLIRDQMYPALESRLGASDRLVELGMSTADVIIFRESLRDQYYQHVAPMESFLGARSFFEYVLLTKVDTRHPLYAPLWSRVMPGRALQKWGVLPSPGRIFNETFRKGIGRFGRFRATPWELLLGVYRSGTKLTWIVSFPLFWWYFINKWGLLLGIGLGWLMSVAAATIVAPLWPIAALGAALLLWKIFG